MTETKNKTTKKKAAPKKKQEVILTPEEKAYLDALERTGLDSLTELRFISKRVVMKREGVGRSTMKYLNEYLASRGLTYGNHTFEDYKENKETIWKEACGLIVFKYKIRSLLPGMGLGIEWAVGEFTPDKENYGEFGKPRIMFRGVTRRDALGIIDDNGLTLALETKDGVIYDTPERKFLRQFGHKGSDLSRAHYIPTAGKQDYNYD